MWTNWNWNEQFHGNLECKKVKKGRKKNFLSSPPIKTSVSDFDKMVATVLIAYYKKSETKN